MSATGLLIGVGDSPVNLLPRYSNRHGLITGATGTGKTVTLQTIAEQFSALGVPVFMADVKGDLSGLLQPGGGNPRVEERAAKMGLAPMPYRAYPVVFWDIFARQGHPVRAAVSEMGPLLLSRLLDLNDTQEGVLNLVFKVADDQGLLLLDLNDLRAMLGWVGENAKELTLEYGNVSSASVGAIQRALLVLEQQGGELLFGEPALKLSDLMRTSAEGLGNINILAADELMQNPRLYSTFLLWLLSELFEELPEVGDLDKPKLVFFFDEAHLLFNDAPEALTDKVELVVRLIRSKGVGVYFVSQSPLDVPMTVLGQMGNRVQHALRAFTPIDQRAVRAAADTFRANPKFDCATAITELGVGEALVSVLDPKGAPTVVERVFIKPPNSRIGPCEPAVRDAAFAVSPLRGVYDQAIDRESAFEGLKARAAQAAADAETAREAAAEAKRVPPQSRPPQVSYEQRAPRPTGRTRAPSDALASAATSVLRGAGSQLGRSLVRGILGSLFKGR